MGVPSFHHQQQKHHKYPHHEHCQQQREYKHTTNRYECKKLGLIAILAIIVIINVGDANAFDSLANDQYEFHKEFERLHKQVKPQTYSLQDQIASNQQYNRRTPVYQKPQFNLANIPNREHHFGVQQQEQRQEQHQQQQRILEIENTKYSIWPHNMTYLSSTGYNALGMLQLYNLTNTIIDLFIDKNEPIPAGFIEIDEMTVSLGPNVQRHQYYEILKKYWLIIIIAIVTIITALLMPLIGLCFCCCRCAGACGGRSQPFDKKHDTCRRFFLGFILLCVVSSMIFGVIVAFVTNITLQHGVENATISARYAVDDTRTYLKSTSYQVNHLLVTNYGELKEHLFHTLDKTSETVVAKLDKASNAVSLDTLHDIVESLPQIQSDLLEMNRVSKDMQQKASQLNDGLRGVKRELLNALQQCRTNECKQVQQDYEIGRLDENNIHYDKELDRYYPRLPDQTEIINNVQSLLDGPLQQTVDSSEKKIKDIRNEIENIIKSNVPEVKMSINKVGQAMQEISNRVTREIDGVSDLVGNNTYKYFITADDYIAQYSIYRYYGGLIVSSVLLIILVFATFGLLCGICGKRPDGYGDDCCTKGAGSRFLMCSVALIFLTISVLLVICLALFLSGLVMRRGVCDPLRDPENDQIVTSYLDKFIDVNKFVFPKGRKVPLQANEGTDADSEPLRISHIIGECHRNNSIFKVFGVEKHINISQIEEFPKKYGIDVKLNELADNVGISSQVKILSDEARREIRQLSKSQLNNFQAYKYVDNLTQNITHFDLISLADRLKVASTRLSTSSEIKTKIDVQELHLRTYQKNLVDPLLNGTNRLLSLAKSLDEKLHFKQTTFEKAIMKLIQEIDEAERFLNEQGTSYVQQISHELLDNFSRNVKAYLSLVINTTTNDVGRCEPISNVYNSTIVTVCNRVVDPFNGFWAGVIFCVLLFFPTIVLSAKLSTLYQKIDPYPGPLVEAVPKNKRRRKNDRRQGRDRRGDYYEEASPAPSSSNPRDARYNDMAPKNWDNAPPRYQNPVAPPSSEYERPPPYYYSGFGPSSAPSENE
ncbi:prominin-like protein isoform X3 [Chironomus tepperi]|uniref:prominin-like protein isoform X3 n=1 Tax=Chironomus tepperi TaxID=113505 RepID=UPI00391F698B